MDEITITLDPVNDATRRQEIREEHARGRLPERMRWTARALRQAESEYDESARAIRERIAFDA